MKPILQGMRVVEGSAFVAAPLGGMTLAQLGADVVRFDPIAGGLDYGRWPLDQKGSSLFWAGLNKGKRSIRLDLATAEGRDLAVGLITASQGGSVSDGLFLSNFPARGWLDYAGLSSLRKDLVFVNVLGDRQGGSAVDYTVNCAVGFTHVTGPSGHADPVNAVLPAWDNITGQMAAVALLAAERHRQHTGEGQYVSLALKDVALATAGHLGNLAEAELTGRERDRYGNYLYGAFGRDFCTSDGRRVMLVALTSRQWQNLTEAVDDESGLARLRLAAGNDLADEGERFLAREQIAAWIEPWVAGHEYADLEKKLRQHHVCWGPYQTFLQLLREDADCSPDNPLFEQVAQPGVGTYLMPGSPLYFSACQHLPPAAAPVLGANTDEVLSEFLGLTAAEIGRLHDRGLVAGPLSA